MSPTKNEVLMKYFGFGMSPENRIRASMQRLDAMKSFIPQYEECTKLQVPYTAPGFTDIPTVAEIKKAMVENNLKRQGIPSAVCGIGKFVVKCGGIDIVTEAEDMLYVQQHSQVRVPKVYAVFAVKREIESHPPRYYVVTEFIEGGCLRYDDLMALDENSQKLYCERLGEQFRLLRAIPAPPGQGYGRVYNQGMDPRFPHLALHYDRFSGPYETYEDYISALYSSAEVQLTVQVSGMEFYDPALYFLRNIRPILGESCARKPVLTHADPKPGNIIAKPIKGEGGEIVDWEITLVDWEFMAWLPEWAQYSLLDNYWRFYQLDPENRDKFTKHIYARFGEDYACTKEVEFTRYGMASFDWAIHA